MLGTVPTLNGLTIFGRSYTFNSYVLARAGQRVALPGVDGLAHLDLGYRGSETSVTGFLYGYPLASYQAAIQGFESFRDGRAYVLIDNRGLTWPAAVLEDLRYAPISGPDPQWGFWTTYQATFFQLAYHL